MTTRHLATREWPAFLVALLFVSPLIYWGLDRRAPVSTISVSVLPPVIHAGDTIYRVVTVDRKRVCETDPEISIIDGARTRWRIEENELVRPGNVGVESYRVPVVVPLTAAPGKAEMRITVVRRCNPVHELFPLVEVFPPIHFEILPPETKALLNAP